MHVIYKGKKVTSIKSNAQHCEKVFCVIVLVTLHYSSAFTNRRFAAQLPTTHESPSLSLFSLDVQAQLQSLLPLRYLVHSQLVFGQQYFSNSWRKIYYVYKLIFKASSNDTLSGGWHLSSVHTMVVKRAVPVFLFISL